MGVLRGVGETSGDSDSRRGDEPVQAGQADEDGGLRREEREGAPLALVHRETGARAPGRGDRHPLLRGLSLRHPPGEGRVGRRAFSRWCRATRSWGASRRSAARSPVQGGRPRRAWAASSTPAAMRALPRGPRAVLREGLGAHLQRHARWTARRRPTAATPPRSWSTRLHPEASRPASIPRARRPAPVRGHHHLLAAPPVDARTGTAWRWWAWAGSGTWR